MFLKFGHNFQLFIEKVPFDCTEKIWMAGKTRNSSKVIFKNNSIQHESSIIMARDVNFCDEERTGDEANLRELT